jgi:hypothetical protein
VARFRQALAVAPGNLITTVNLAQALLQLDPEEHRDEADRLLLQVIEAQPYGELAKKAKELRSSIAARDLRADQQDGLGQDAVSYCLQALQLFEGMDQQRFIAVLSEVAADAGSGLRGGDRGGVPGGGAVAWKVRDQERSRKPCRTCIRTGFLVAFAWREGGRLR